MSKTGRRVFVMDNRAYSIIFARYLEGFEDYITCRRCNKTIQIGEEIESHRIGRGHSTKRNRSYNHTNCT